MSAQSGEHTKQQDREKEPECGRWCCIVGTNKDSCSQQEPIDWFYSVQNKEYYFPTWHSTCALSAAAVAPHGLHLFSASTPSTCLAPRRMNNAQGWEETGAEKEYNQKSVSYLSEVRGDRRWGADLLVILIKTDFWSGGTVYLRRLFIYLLLLLYAVDLLFTHTVGKSSSFTIATLRLVNNPPWRWA